MKWYEAVLVAGAVVGIYSLLSASRDRGEERDDDGGVADAGD
ncbi:MAG: hypothetical protein OXU25_02610 [Thaumarchaeota archaeon]|nr:hypothetical protein [Nitrososphaerota archaeon]